MSLTTHFLQESVDTNCEVIQYCYGRGMLINGDFLKLGVFCNVVLYFLSHEFKFGYNSLCPLIMFIQPN